MSSRPRGPSVVTPENRITNARGYIGLGMLDEADRELRQLPRQYWDSAQMAMAVVEYLEARKLWSAMKMVAEGYAREFPQEKGFWQLTIDRAGAAMCGTEQPHNKKQNVTE